MFTAVNVVLSLLIGLGIALLLNRVSTWARLVLTAVLLFVWAVPSTVSTQVFYWMFTNQYGAVELPARTAARRAHAGHDWFADPHQGLAVVTAVVVWGAIPLLAISLHAGITQIPKEFSRRPGWTAPGLAGVPQRDVAVPARRCWSFSRRCR